MLDFRLRVFYTVAKLLNFTKAAATLHISQPAVTKHIKELEQSYKVTLFDRQPNALSLTGAGRLLYKYAGAIMEQYDLLEFDINALNEKIAGELCIAASATVARYVLPPILASFNERLPDVRLHILEGSSSRVQQLLMDNVVDAGFIEGTADKPGLQYIPYLEDEMVLACGMKNNVLTKTSFSIYDLYKLQYVACEDDLGIWDVISRQLKNAGALPGQLKIDIHLSSIESIKLFLMNSATHFAFIPYRALINSPGFNNIKIIGVDNLDVNRTFYIALQQQELSPTLASFIRFLRIAL